jgi:hypothetical protein
MASRCALRDRIGDGAQKARDLFMVFACVALEIRQRREVVRLGEREAGRAIADGPEEHALDQVNVVQPVLDRGIQRRRRMRLDRSPVFRIGPDLMSVEIAKQCVHDDCIICNVSRPATRKIEENRVACRLHDVGAWTPPNSIA